MHGNRTACPPNESPWYKQYLAFGDKTLISNSGLKIFLQRFCVAYNQYWQLLHLLKSHYAYFEHHLKGCSPNPLSCFYWGHFGISAAVSLLTIFSRNDCYICRDAPLLISCIRRIWMYNYIQQIHPATSPSRNYAYTRSQI